MTPLHEGKINVSPSPGSRGPFNGGGGLIKYFQSMDCMRDTRLPPPPLTHLKPLGPFYLAHGPRGVFVGAHCPRGVLLGPTAPEGTFFWRGGEAVVNRK